MQGTLYLAHHGVKGMKWGVRRYRNPDGSLNEAGKERYYKWKGPDTFRYRRLNRKADRGDRLRAGGNTITSKSVVNHYAKVGVAMLGIPAAEAMGGKNISMRYGNVFLGNVNRDTILAGTLAVEAALTLKNFKDSSDIRASYRREQTRSQYWAG